MDSNLLKEAIADAKAVRQTALANAKVALEEQFNEKYQAMFAEKLKEDAEQSMNQSSEQGVNPPQDNVSEQEIDELIKELESEVGGPEEQPHAEPDGDELPGAVPPQAPTAPGAVPPGIPGEQPQFGTHPAAPGALGAPVPPTMPAAPGVSPVLPMGGEQSPFGTPPAAPGAPGAPVPPMGGEQPQGGLPTPPSDVPPTGEETDEDVDLNELLQSLKEEVEEEEEGKNEDECLDEQKKLTSSGVGGNKAGGSDNKKPASGASSASGIESDSRTVKSGKVGMPIDYQTSVGPEDATKAKRPNQASNATSTDLSTPKMGGQKGPALKAARPNCTGDFEGTANLEENVFLKKQLNEAEEVIKYVKGQLNEVNLLNAKLLYTNKLFKEYNMHNEHKMRIVEMFDLAKTVREVKLTYANIAESLNISGNNTRKKVVATTNSSVQSITEGLASKPVGSTKPKEIITEGKFATRMKQLAGIRSEQKK